MPFFHRRGQTPAPTVSPFNPPLSFRSSPGLPLTLLAIAAALLAVLAGGLAVGSGGRWVTGGRWLLPVAALLAITGLLAIGALLPVAALLGVSALIVTAWLRGGIAAREKRWERWDDEAIPWQRAPSSSCWKAMQFEAVFRAVNHFKS